MSVKTFARSQVAELAPPITGEMLFKLGDIGRVELVKGEIIDMSPAGHFHGYVESNFDRALGVFVYPRKLGRVLVGEVGIYTQRHPDTVRGADVIFISHERLAQVQSQSYLDVAPEIIVEVLSPDDSWSKVMEKIEEYFAIGTVLVWIADPRRQQIHVYRSPTDVQRLTSSELLSGDEVLPGFSVPIAELFAAE